jgi:hypothetical protein
VLPVTAVVAACCCSFSHVLGLDGDPLHVVAAKEMKERGQVNMQISV